MKIALFGDSFGYQKSNQPFESWVDLLSHNHTINNYCECGVGEYKILQQIKSSQLSDYDKIIITHTSPTRVFVKYNPLHANSVTHKNCDILLADVESRNDEFSQLCQEYFKYIFDISYAIDIHNMICNKIDLLVQKHSVIHITHFDYSNCYKFPNLINFYKLWLSNQGEVNHYNQRGNQQVHLTVKHRLDHQK